MNLQTHHMQRISQQYTDGSNTIEKVWAGACEFVTKNGQQYKYTYLSGPLGLFAIHIIKPDGNKEINYNLGITRINIELEFYIQALAHSILERTQKISDIYTKTNLLMTN